MVPPEQLSKLWHMHSARLLLVARAIGEPAEDAVQEAFIRLSQLDHVPHQPMAWLVRVVRNQLIQWHRSGQRRQRRDQLSSADRQWFVEDDPADRLATQELTSALKQLPETERQIIVLHLWGEMTFEQIAHEVGLSRATAHRRFHEAIDRLRRELEGESASNGQPPLSTPANAQTSGDSHEQT